MPFASHGGMSKVLLALGAAALLLFGFLAFCTFVTGTFCPACLSFHHHGGSNERSAATSLKTLSTAQADFRANDRDGDKIAQFWRGDVAGLYALVPKGSSVAIKLIELSVAAADDRPLTDLSPFAARAPKAAYWFRALRHIDEDPKAPDPDRFAYCAFPISPAAGQWIYIIDESNTIYRAESKRHPGGIDVFPSEEELKTQWSNIDG
jgi:hypothetical protein